MSEHAVTGCVDCPMFNDGQKYEYEATCKHPLAPPQFFDRDNQDAKMGDVKRIEIGESGEYWTKSFYYFPITPDWCPLKKEPITIIFKP